MDDLNKLKKKRKTLKTSCTKLCTKIETALSEDDGTPENFEILMNQLIDKMDAIKQINNEIENLLDIKDIENDIEASEEFQENLIAFKSKLSRKIKYLNSKEQIDFKGNESFSSNKLDENIRINSKVKLPKLTINKYFGDPCNWIEFFNQFESSIHKNESLSSIDKFNYLKSLLGGPALNAVGGLVLTSKNYETAIEILEERFGRTDLTINAHMNKLLNIEPVKNVSNTAGLRRLYDECEVNIRSLDTLKVTSGSYGNLLCPILLKLLPEELALEYNRKRKSKTEFDVNELITFIRTEVECRESVVYFNCKKSAPVVPSFNRNKFENKRYAHTTATAAALVTETKMSCIFCNEMHLSVKCTKLTAEEKRKFLKENGMCYRCFRQGHLSRFCRTFINNCKICKSRSHHESVCVPNLSSRNSQTSNKNEVPKAEENSDKKIIVSSVSEHSKAETILLQTCSAILKGNCRETTVRILLDSASHKSFVTERIAKQIKLPIVRKEELQIYAFGGQRADSKAYEVARLQLENVNKPALNINIEALVTDRITNIGIAVPNKLIRKFALDRGFELSDIGTSVGIDVLIGADYLWEIMSGECIRIDKRLVASDTLFGKTIQGRVSQIHNDKKREVHKNIAFNICVNEECCNETISKQFRAMWEIESMGINDSESSSLDDDAMSKFNANTSFVDGRYQTKLLWKPDHDKLHDNYEIAERRLVAIKKRFERDPWLFNEYSKILDEQLKEGIIEECLPENEEFNGTSYYLPHHCVIRRDKSTTKVRVVYDASASGKGIASLNECLISGPNLNPDLLTILLRFRIYRIAFVSDIEKAFLQISLKGEDREFLRFLWINEDLNGSKWKTFRSTRVPFGIRCSMFLLAATIRHHLTFYEARYPKACEMLKNLYVDDLIFGEDSAEAAFTLSTEAVEIIRAAGMTLRKWKTNSEELNALWRKDKFDCPISMEDSDCNVKVLGMVWNNKEDVFKFDLTSIIDSLKFCGSTKRHVLKTVAQLFDPLGLITPFTVRIKCLLQELWEKGIPWDETLPLELRSKFEAWCKEVPDLKELQIPRPYFICGISKSVEAHIFCDASQRAYGAVAYMRMKKNEESWVSSFILSKSRVAPLKQLTLPRLELMGALIASRVAKYLKNVFHLKDSNIILWTDSQIVLHWIKGSARLWKPFVANRVLEIQENTDPQNWNFCVGKQNPADKLTRGLKAVNLLTDKSWWYGPDWLMQSTVNCTDTTTLEDIETEKVAEEKRPETRVLQMVCQSKPSHEALLDLEKYSKLSKVFRITAWIQRFIQNAKSREQKIGTLSAEELKTAEVYWVKNVQSERFSAELGSLEKGKSVDKSSCLYDFNPVLDSHGIVCVGGRLQNSELQPQQKHPWIIPGKSRFTELVILHNHCKIFHSGVADTLIQVREVYWIIRGRQTVKGILNKCLICRKFKARPGETITAPLPKDRIQESSPFDKTGIDFAGPLYAKGKEKQKCYIALFTCAVTRAIHLELVTDLSTETFLLALRRFFSRRGISTVIYSDNARTFKRANLELKELWSTISDPKVKDFYGTKGVKWKYIVERGAWWGGFWERMVKSVKVCLRKVLGKTSLKLDELNTTLTEVESTINSRPITYVYSDSDEPSPLTPAHFLIGKRLTSLPPVCQSSKTDIFSAKRAHILKIYLYRQRLLENFWKRWKHEYLLLLRSAVNVEHVKDSKEFKLDDVVLVSEDKVPRNFWKLGRITEVHRGRDDKVRSCTIKTFSGTLKRPIQLLHNLELSN